MSDRRVENDTEVAQDIIHPGAALWSEVPNQSFAMLPWTSICRVIVQESDGTLAANGTGWLAGAHTVITSAHVVADRLVDGRVVVMFPGSSAVTAAQDIVLGAYQNNPSLGADPNDIAAIRVADVSRPPIPHANAPAAIATVELSGYPGLGAEALVTQTGTAQRHGDLLLHTLDAEPGHSGAPIIARSPGLDGTVIGIHVMPSTASPISTPLMNVALALVPTLSAFIAEYVGNWR